MSDRSAKRREGASAAPRGVRDTLGRELDWGDGDYAHTAAELEPVAERTVDAVGVEAGWSVLDVGCGTGNVALVAARRGARVVGVDPAARLLDEARQRAADARLDVEFCSGEASSLPVSDAAFDAVISVFGVVFAADASRACGELMRAARPGGTVALTAWLPGGAVHAAVGVLRRSLPEASAPENRWDDPDWVEQLLRAHGARAVRIDQCDLVFRAGSPEAWLAEAETHHPAWRWARRTLPADRWEAVRTETVTALREGNEDAAAFAATGHFALVRRLR